MLFSTHVDDPERKTKTWARDTEVRQLISPKEASKQISRLGRLCSKDKDKSFRRIIHSGVQNI